MVFVIALTSLYIFGMVKGSEKQDISATKPANGAKRLTQPSNPPSLIGLKQSKKEGSHDTSVTTNAISYAVSILVKQMFPAAFNSDGKLIIQAYEEVKSKALLELNTICRDIIDAARETSLKDGKGCIDEKWIIRLTEKLKLRLIVDVPGLIKAQLLVTKIEEKQMDTVASVLSKYITDFIVKEVEEANLKLLGDVVAHAITRASKGRPFHFVSYHFYYIVQTIRMHLEPD